MFEEILSCYGIPSSALVQSFGTGLINSTWRVTDGHRTYILQRINNSIFKEPSGIAANIEIISRYLKRIAPGYVFAAPLKTKTGKSMVRIDETNYFRLFPFVEGSHTIDVVHTPMQAFEAAKQFGTFTKKLTALPLNTLSITLPGFHNLLKRFEHFTIACDIGNEQRIEAAKEEIAFLRQQANIVSTYRMILSSPDFKLRVTHHDTKISNVLFDKDDKGICVIDLDTVMPGYFISDVGDMMRTYLSPVSEEENELSRVEVRDAYFKAILEGYLSEMGEELSHVEIGHFVYAGKFMIYMQALRFLTDHLNDDIYYGAAYEGQNYTRAQNQVTLLQRLMDKETQLKQMVAEVAAQRVRRV